MMSGQCSQRQKTISTSENVAGDGREETTGGIVGRKRSSPSSQTDSYKVSRPLVCTTVCQPKHPRCNAAKGFVLRPELWLLKLYLHIPWATHFDFTTFDPSLLLFGCNLFYSLSVFC